MTTLKLQDSIEGTVTLEVSDLFTNHLNDPTHKIEVIYSDGDKQSLAISKFNIDLSDVDKAEWLRDNVGIEGTDDQVTMFNTALNF
jgi:hypothetical protein